MIPGVEIFFMIPGVEIFFKHFQIFPALLTVLMILVFQIGCYRDKALKHTWRFFQLMFAFLLAMLILIALMQTNYHSSAYQGELWVCRGRARCVDIMKGECGITPLNECSAFQDGIKILEIRAKIFLQKHAENVKIIASMHKMGLISIPAISAS
jgi:hypothetical protein